MKKIFLDCGSHYGEGFQEFTSILKIDDTWNCFLFEPNRVCYDFLKKNFNYKNITLLNKAVFDKNINLIFRAELAGNTSKYDGVCSSILNDDIYHFNYGSEEYEVETVDLSKFILDLYKEDCEIYCKMDIEGAEFSVLEKMILDESIKCVTKFFIEFHDWTMQPKHIYEEKKQQIIKYCNENNIELNLWK